jgi:N-acetylmuramoyl-L-alanine amidase
LKINQNYVAFGVGLCLFWNIPLWGGAYAQQDRDQGLVDASYVGLKKTTDHATKSPLVSFSSDGSSRLDLNLLTEVSGKIAVQNDGNHRDLMDSGIDAAGEETVKTNAVKSNRDLSGLGLAGNESPNISGNISGNIPANIPAQMLNTKGAVLAQVPIPVVRSLRLQGVQVRSDGIFLSINGEPESSILRVENPARLVIDLQDTAVAAGVHNTTVPINRFGVRQVRVAQFQKSPRFVGRLVLDLDESGAASNTSWRIVPLPGRGVLLQPSSGVVSNPLPSNNNGSNGNTNNGVLLIEGLSFNNLGQLVVEGSQGFTYQVSNNVASNTATVTIPSAKISPQFRRPTLGANSPIEQIRLTQVGNSVQVSVKTVRGWQAREGRRPNAQQMALQLSSSSGPVVRNPATNTPPSSNPNTQNPVTNRGRGVVVIDAGHGGPDVGATANGLYEKDIALAISQRLGNALEKMGYTVVYTRTDDSEIDLEPRVQIAEDSKANVFVSIHLNSLESRSETVNGVETYFAPGSTSGEALARAVHEEIIGATNANDRGVRSARFYVIRKTSMPAILVETGFITSPEESSNLNTPSYQQKMADAIARGVDAFLKGKVNQRK